MKDKKEKKMLYAVIGTLIVVLSIVIADGVLYYTSLQQDGVGRGFSRYFERQEKENGDKDNQRESTTQRPTQAPTDDVYVYYESELIRESSSWEEPSFYVTTDDIEDVLFFHETSYPEYNYNVIFNQYYEFLHYEAEEMNEGYGSEETNEWIEENMLDDIFVYRVEVVEFTYLEEYFSINEITDLEIDEGSILIAVYYHR